MATMNNYKPCTAELIYASIYLIFTLFCHFQKLQTQLMRRQNALFHANNTTRVLLKNNSDIYSMLEEIKEVRRDLPHHNFSLFLDCAKWAFCM